ncbi:MAG: hypothetical protein Q7S86_04850 [bacterium]|nr:hypothetical protein [bacterium]
MISITTPDGRFVLFVAERISSELPGGSRFRTKFLMILRDEPELIEGFLLLRYEAIIELASAQGIKPVFSKDQGLREISVFLQAFFEPELAILP